MNIPAYDLAAHARRLLTLQAIVAVVVAVGAGFQGGVAGAIAAVYGALVSMASTLVLSRGVARAQAAAETNPQRAQTMLYLGAVQRFAMVLVLLAIGIWGLHFEPMPLVIAFAVAQLMFAVQGQRLRRP